MAFIRINWQKITSSINDAEPRGWSYSSTTDSLSTIQSGTGYFNELIGEVREGDLLHVRASNGSRLFQFGPLSGNDITVLNATKNTLMSGNRIVTVGASAEEHPVDIVATGKIVTAFLFVDFGTTTIADYTFEFRDTVAGLLGSTTVTNGATAGNAFFVGISPNFQVGLFQNMFWRKLTSNAAVITLNSYIKIEVD